MTSGPCFVPLVSVESTQHQSSKGIDVSTPKTKQKELVSFESTIWRYNSDVGRLDKQSIARIQRRLAARESTAIIAESFQVSAVTIRKIRRRMVSAGELTGTKRGQRGDKNGRSKLSYSDVELIKAQVAAGTASQAALARMFKVSRSLVSKICKGDRWTTPRVSASAPFMKMDLRRHRPSKGSLEEGELVEEVFSHYRTAGYPVRTIAKHRIGPVFKSLRDGPSVLSGRRLEVSSRGLKLANAFHPQLDSVRCRNTRTPVEVFGDDALLRKAILKHIRYGHHLTPQGIRYAVYHYGGAQWASNFRPAVVKSLVDLLAGERVLDPCMGFGGRLLGAVAGGRAYVGVDPAHRTVVGNRRMVEAVEGAGVALPPTMLVEGCSEDELGHGRYGRFSFAITSPPYFDVEHYDSAPSQSCNRYPEFSEWIRWFLKPLVVQTNKDLLPYGYLALNIAPELLPCVRAASFSCGLRELTVFDYELYVRQFKQSKQGRCRSEPLILFQRMR